MKTGPRITVLVTVGTALLATTYVLTLQSTPPKSAEPRTLVAAPGEVKIVRQPPPSVVMRRMSPLTALPSYDPKSNRGWQVDLRGRDVSALDLEQRHADLRHADFDSRTRWPRQLPSGFDPAALLELNKNPGLGVRQLHARGITGRGIGVAIVDQTLLVTHAEYRDRLRSYEEIHLYGDDAQMHGPAVASIAVGRHVGVAPEADLYYIGATNGTYSGRAFAWDFSALALSIDRLLEINRQLPAERKIRVISISVAWNPSRKGYASVMAAVERATRANVFVLSCALERTHHLSFDGLGRSPTTDPDRAESYGPGSWWASAFWEGVRFAPGEKLLVPMDARAVASPTGDQDYVYYSQGGWSWSVPWLAGLYALACQVRPEITPQLFWAEALRTGRTVRLRRDDVSVDFGTIADPLALIIALQQTHAM